MKQTQTRALVLSGGGTSGGAWMAGYISALRGQGVDLGDADLIIGTSAGARTAAQLATGTLDEAVQRYCRGDVPAVELHATLPEFMAASAVDAETGHRIAFGADSGAGLLDAVAASGALPGMFPLVTIDGRRYADGGTHSLYNADLAAGHDVVIVLTPLPFNDYFRATLDAEVAALGTAAVHVLTADQESLAGIGPDAAAAGAVPAAADAGTAQARRDIARLRAIWPARAGRAV